jgi:hypothetical protein
MIYWFKVSNGSELMLRLFLIVGTMWKWAALPVFQRNMPPFSGCKGEDTLNIEAAPVYQII